MWTSLLFPSFFSPISQVCNKVVCYYLFLLRFVVNCLVFSNHCSFTEERNWRIKDQIFLQVEISICRVYKRPGVEDRPRLPGTLGSKPSSSRGTGMNRKHNTSHHQIGGDSQEVRDGSSTSLPSSSLQPKPAVHGSTTASVASLSSTTSTEEDGTSFLQSNNMSGVTPTCSLLPHTSPSMATQMIDELNRLVGFNQNRMNNPSQFLHPPSQTQLQLPFNALPMSLTTASDKLWEWSALQETGREYTDFEWSFVTGQNYSHYRSISIPIYVKL